MNEQAIIDRYEIGETIEQISKDYQCTRDKIRWTLKKRNALVSRKIAKCYLPEEEIVDLYKKDISLKDIAKKFNVSTGPISSILKKHNIRKPVWLKTLPYKVAELVLNKEWFSEIVDRCISKEATAREIGCGESLELINHLYRYHGIKSLSSADTRSLLIRRERKSEHELDRITFNKLHFTDGIQQYRIGKLMGVSPGFLRKKIKEWDITPISGSEIRLSDEFKQLRIKPNILKTEIQTNTLRQLCKKYKISMDTLRNLFYKSGIEVPLKYRSTAEKSIEDFIVMNNPNKEIIVCDRKIISPFELDLYIPENKLAIEYCGLYWHSEMTGKDSTYHLKKLERCQKKGIDLLTIFEDEYYDKQDLVENKINNKLNIFNRGKINARQCNIANILPAQKKEFLNRYHLQGNDVSQIYLGLFFKSKLVSVMTFARPSRSRASSTMINNNLLWELNRYATDYNYIVRGGAGKLLEYFKRNYEWENIYSYADRRWSNGNLYTKLGFVLSNVSRPSYWYVPPGCHKREYRFTYTKHKLISEGFDPNLTEKEIMEQRGFTRIWDCGMLKFVLENSSRTQNAVI